MALLAMAMSFISRLSRVVRANANALVSGTEDPVRILDQALMDNDEDVDHGLPSFRGPCSGTGFRVLSLRDRTVRETPAQWGNKEIQPLHST